MTTETATKLLEAAILLEKSGYNTFPSGWYIDDREPMNKLRAVIAKALGEPE